MKNRPGEVIKSVAQHTPFNASARIETETRGSKLTLLSRRTAVTEVGGLGRPMSCVCSVHNYGRWAARAQVTEPHQHTGRPRSCHVLYVTLSTFLDV